MQISATNHYSKVINTPELKRPRRAIEEDHTQKFQAPTPSSKETKRTQSQRR